MTRRHDHDLYERQGIGSQIGFGDAPGGRSSSTTSWRSRAARSRATTPRPRCARPRASAPPRARSARRSRYSYCAYEADLSDAGPFGVKCPGLVACRAAAEGCEIDPLVAPAGGDVVFEKQQPSAFFGTDLHERSRRARRRHRDRLRHDDVGLRARDGRRRDVARLPHDRARRGRLRPGARAASLGALRHGPQVRRRRARARRTRARSARLVPARSGRSSAARTAPAMRMLSASSSTIAFARARRTAMPLTSRKSAMRTNENSVVSTPSAKMYAGTRSPS